MGKLTTNRERKGEIVGDILTILFFTVIAIIFTSGYSFGVSDHSITIPFLKHSIDGQLYANDYLITQIPYYYTFLWITLGQVVAITGIKIYLLFFVLYFLSTYFAFWGIFLLAKELTGKREAGFLAIFFMSIGIMTLAEVELLAPIYLTRTQSLPLLIFALYFQMRERDYIALVLCGIAFLIHPLSASYVIAMLSVDILRRYRVIGWKGLILRFGMLLVLISPILIWKATSAPPSMHLFTADADWIRLLEIRSAHHIFPFAWDRRKLLNAFFIAVLFVIAIWKGRDTLKDERRKRVASWVAVIFVLCILGVIGSEIIPISIVLNLQLLRSYQYFVHLTIIFYAGFLLRDRGRVCPMAALVSFPLFWLTDGGVTLWGIFVLLSIAQQYLYQKGKHIAPLFPVLVVIAAALLIGKPGDFKVTSKQDESWLDLQRWAKDNTEIDAVFIVPYDTQAFRIESGRSIYGDWKDGTLTNFNPDFGREWMDRMETLGYDEGYSSLSGEDFLNITKGMADTYIVTRDSLDFSLLYRNDEYSVYIPSKEVN